jgi:hypothetical protein
MLINKRLQIKIQIYEGVSKENRGQKKSLIKGISVYPRPDILQSIPLQYKRYH